MPANALFPRRLDGRRQVGSSIFFNVKLVSPLLALALAASTSVAFAATANDSSSSARPAGGPPPHRGSPLVRAIDTDHDHVLSAAEIAAAPTSLKTLDTDGDGAVSTTEMRPTPPADAPQPPADRPAPPAGARPQDPILLVLDANSDGALSTTEITNATASLLALDADKDGQLTRDEFHPLPPDGAAPADLPPPGL